MFIPNDVSLPLALPRFAPSKSKTVCALHYCWVEPATLRVEDGLTSQVAAGVRKRWPSALPFTNQFSPHHRRIRAGREG